MSAMLPFQVDILKTLTSNAIDSNALWILARGLGLRNIICQMLKVYDEPSNLVLLINATEEEERGIGEEIGMKLKAVAYEMPAKDRRETYLQGGIVSVTSRILVVDMLNKIVPVDHITGLVVLQAENVTPTSTEAFIVRIYREHNTTGFLKAFSDQPEQFHFGLAPLQTVVTQLKIRHVHIWPRFREEVDKALKKRKADVQEMYQPMSESMEDMQSAILECMEATLAEIKRSCSTWLETDDLTFENALFRTFDRIVRSQLDPHWHKISSKTKQLVSDLTTLRKLLSYLQNMDCVSFNQFLETVITSNGIGMAKQDKSPWLFLPAAEQLIQTARRRVYIPANEAPITASTSKNGIETQETAKTTEENEYWAMLEPDDDEEAAFEELMRQEGFDVSPSTSRKGKEKARPQTWFEKMKIQPVLEEQPKWALVGEVMDEIEKDLHWSDHDPDARTTDCVLIMCDAMSTCAMLRAYLASDPEDGVSESTGIEESGHRSARKLLLRRLKNYFFWKGAFGKMSKNLKPNINGQNGTVLDSNQLPEISAALKRKKEYQKTQPAYKRRRTRGAGATVVDSRNDRKRAAEGSELELLEQEAGEVALNLDANGILKVEDGESLDDLQDTMLDTFDEEVFEEYFGLVQNEELIVIRSYSGDDDDRLLEELRPKYIIMYDPDPAFVRRIETYKNCHAGLAMRVYFLAYQNSVEEQRYLASVRREKEAFERIINERKNMAITLEAERRPGERSEEDNLRTFSSRVAGGSKSLQTTPPTVIVDVREFRSSLPGLLHQANLVVEPLTLLIGDYVLSPDMCVERKSIPDLVQSFNSGRLYQQCDLMSIYYRQPILLIEFDQKKSFSLQTYTDPKSTKNSTVTQSDTDLHSKLVLLTLTFPKLRIIWSSSPYITAEIFADLKNNNAEPNGERAAALGAEDQFGNPLNAEGNADTATNLTAQEMLRTLPGITSKNFRYVMKKTENMEELLSQKSLEQIGELIGLEAARQLLNFANKDSIGDGT